MKTRLSFVLPVLAGCLLPQIAARAAADLPLKRITLFTSGVGFFQREGEVTGDTSVELSFRPEQINDLLKSLVLQDFGGGKIAPVVFGSRDPTARTLKSFAIDLSDNPPLDVLLNRLRGVPVEVAAPKEIQGVIVGTETQRQKVKDEVVEVHLLNLLTDAGLRALPLDQVQQIKVLDAPLDNELRSALKVLATSHDAQRKPVVLSFTGQGQRRVSAGYVLEAPVWRTSYRLELQKEKPPFVQGWALVENTTDDDWKGVNLTLVSGRPISFIMDLYQPLYLQRPTVVPETYASLRPPVYEGAVAAMEAPALQARAASTAGRGGRAGGMGGGGFGAAPAAAAVPLRQEAMLDLADRGVRSMSTATGVGELFQYAIDQPVTVERHKSAMLPIVNAPIAAQKVSIYNESVQKKFPLNGLRLTNTTSLVLMQGPITIFDAGVYAGDARIEDLQPKEERLLSYAMDLKVEVEPLQQDGTNEVTAIQIRKGVATVSHRLLQTKTYTIRNKADEKRIVLVEHPFRPDWKLLEPSKPAERTPAVYRFQVPVDAGKSDKLAVKEEHLLSETVALVSADLNLLVVYSRNAAIHASVRTALEKVVSMRNGLADVQRRRADTEQRINDYSQEQARIRENMRVLAQNSDLYARYVKELDQQETQIASLRDQLSKLRSDEESQRKQLDDYLANLQVD